MNAYVIYIRNFLFEKKYVQGLVYEQWVNGGIDEQTDMLESTQIILNFKAKEQGNSPI